MNQTQAVPVRRFTPGGKEISNLNHAEILALLEKLRGLANTPSQFKWIEKMNIALEIQASITHGHYLTVNQVNATLNIVEQARASAEAKARTQAKRAEENVEKKSQPVTPPAAKADPAPAAKNKPAPVKKWNARNGLAHIRKAGLKGSVELANSEFGLYTFCLERGAKDSEFSEKLITVFEANGGKPPASKAFKRGYELRKKRGFVPAPAAVAAKIEAPVQITGTFTAETVAPKVKWYNRMLARVGLAIGTAAAIALASGVV